MDELEQATGVPINYEDPRFACAGEIRDVTAKVQSPAQKAANPHARILVPKGGRLTLKRTIPSQRVDLSSALYLAARLRDQHERKGFPGRFAVKQAAGALFVQPKAVRGADCVWKPVAPVMETRITLPAQKRDATATVQSILDTVSKRIGIKLGLGSLSILAFVNRTVTVGADDEPANLVLLRVFEQLLQQDSPSRRAQYWFSYHLLYDPGVKYYLIHIDSVSRWQRGLAQ